MLEIVKIASELKESNDIKITAGILSRLKNKIVNLFSKSKREKVENMVEQAEELKPKLVETYNTIKEIEDAISDLDVPKYESEIIKLQPAIEELNVAVKKMTALTNEERHREKPAPSYIEKYYPGGTLCNNLHEFGEQFGVDIKYGTNIAPSRIGTKNIFVSWAAAVFTGKLRKDITGNTSPGEFTEEHEDPKAFSDLQDQISDSQMANAFYENLPFYKIKSIKGRETRVVDGENTGMKKGGEVEVFLISDWISFPEPAENWRAKVHFVIVDKGYPEKPNNFVIYRQWVVGIKKVT